MPQSGMLKVCLLCLVFIAPVASGDDLFRDHVAPLLSARCLTCHNSDESKGDFSLQTAAKLLDHVEPGDSAASHLVDVIGGNGEPATMPKDGRPLSKKEVAMIRRWVDDGATWPNGFVLTEPVVDNFDWWSLKPIRSVKVPTVEAPGDRSWIRTPVDAFVLKQLKAHKLEHSATADRRTLIRRLTYDLTGLPPTPVEVATFLGDDSPRAYEKLVDRLLASKHYGERWARHWLDVVRYADTCGYDKDKLRPNAWPFRDYVIRSFNDDKPYSRFVEEQIAGDVLYPGSADGILGLGFIAAGPWDFIGHVEVPESKIDGMEARNLDRDEMVSGTLNAFCSTTIQCARCHNHKFDPFTQEHYYSLQAVFAAVDRAERPYDLDPNTETRRVDLTKQLHVLQKQQSSLAAAIAKDGGAELATANALIKKLKSKAGPSSKRPEFGYHSQLAKSADIEKWVEVDLGRDVAIREVVLSPCHDDFGNIGAGFGFPQRFVVTSRTDSGETTTIVDHSKRQFANPRLRPVRIETTRSARFIRVTGTKLFDRSGQFILALSELQAIDDTGRNAAKGAKVSSLDSIEAPVRWRRTNLVDGIWPRAADPAILDQLVKAEAQRAAILARVNTAERQQRAAKLNENIALINKQLAALPVGRMVYAAATRFKQQGNFKPTDGKPRTVRLLHRGNIQQPRNEMQPGAVPLAAGDDWRLNLSSKHTEADRRAALAKWITAKENPLTWRSIVNRIWQYHFGRGIVETPNDFGRMGQQPTHPNLLDWLAADFRDNGQSFKRLHRMIVLSSTYRQASGGREASQKIDSDNRFVWRMSRRRLEAEELRDAVLAVSGRLNKKMGGPGYYLFKLERTEHSPHYEYHKFDPEDEKSHRRSVYRFIVRSQPDPFMTTLDCADSSQSTPRRNETLTSLQALSLLNNRFMLAMSNHFAKRMEAEANTTGERIALGLRLIANREPTAAELKQLTAYADRHGLPNLCRLLFNLSEFVYVD